MTNNEIFRNLPENIKKRDFCCKAVKSNIMAAATANFRFIDELMACKDSSPKEINKSLAKLAADSVKLLGKASADLSMVRKMLVRGQLDPKYWKLCSQRCYTKNLFGDDFNQALKEADDVSKITRTITRSKSATTLMKLPYRGRGGAAQKMKGRFLYQRKQPQNQQQYYQNIQYQPQHQQQKHHQRPKKEQSKPESLAKHSRLASIQLDNEKNLISFQGGRMKNYLEVWKTITYDKDVLTVIRGTQIPLRYLPLRQKIPHQIPFNRKET